MNKSFRMMLTLMVATTPWLVAPVIAAPLTSPLMLKSAAVPSVETVQYRRGRLRLRRRSRRARHRRRTHRRGDYWRNTALRLLLPSGYYGYPPGYYGQAYAVPAPYIGGDAVAYCVQRFRSYDPYSGTYLGYDGLRHPCP